MKNFSRLLPWLIASAVLAFVALYLQAKDPGNLLAVTIYKMHLLALGGWGGYWLDRALFPYDRPHEYLLPEGDAASAAEGVAAVELVAADQYGIAMIRRAIIVAASLLCVGLGA